MHLTLIFIVIVSYSTAYSHPLLKNEQEHQQSRQQHDELNSSTSRPLQQFFIKILSAFRGKSQFSSTTKAPTTTTHRISIPYHQQHYEVQQIPNFVDFSSYLLDSFTNNNSAIKFSYIQPNTTNLRNANYSVISFLVPHDMKPPSEKGPLWNFLNILNLFRSPEKKPPPDDTVFTQFPPFLEYYAQRIQAYFSIYKFPDDSRMNNTIVVEVAENNEVQPQNDDLVDETTETDELILTTTEIFNEME
ncbi:hypothetical protein PVAND_007185 [Polypedilum vanderplanki]|uniref:Uncharacterized protein n=1 Tax=Polypedilum vanderplanki TaxID=319348 RepID=A0A9J6C6H4_POLVA|nr:hypothetical protein PVAND_007185 [Polypedilum vanderplanki]